jgi:thioredoxin reductase
MTDARPYPPGEYGVVVVGSGPGGLQASYYLSRMGIDHAVISADPAPGGMFRRFPLLQRLLSWTKPHARHAHHSREFERYDFNSLIAEEPEHRAIMPDLMDGSSEFPARAEMEAGLVAFAEVTGVRVRHDTPWQGTSRDGDAFVLHTPDGEYRTRVPLFAVGASRPRMPVEILGYEHARHYVDTREPASYAGKRLYILGKANSAFELATGLLQWASPIILGSPRAAQLSINLHSLGGVRARYVQPWEDAELGGGVFILDAVTERLERHADGIAVHTRRPDTAEPFVAEVDEVIAATGFTAPLLDLEELGVSTFGPSGLPSMTNHYESATVPGIFFGGTISQGVSGLKKFGIPANSGAVHGFRYNMRLATDTIGARYFDIHRTRPAVSSDQVVDRLLASASLSPELWHQKSYLAHSISRDADGVIRDDGIVSLAEYVDQAGPDGAAITVETDDKGDIHPAVYVRRRGRVDADAVLDGSPLTDYRSGEHHHQLQALLGDVLS